MTMRGVKVLDHVADIFQVDWLVVSKGDCRSTEEERRLIAAHFRKPHEPWGAVKAFVAPVHIRHGRTRILFRQESGLRLS